MAQSRQKFAFARCGASVALAATLSLSMVPATALAEVDSDAQGGAVAAAAADIVQTPDGFYVEKGKAYAQMRHVRRMHVRQYPISCHICICVHVSAYHCYGN